MERWWGITFCCLAFGTGCRPMPTPADSAPTTEAAQAVQPSVVRPPPPRRADNPAASNDAAPTGPSEEGELSPVAAADLVWNAIDESLEYSPTLVVWLFDGSASAQGLVSQVTSRIRQHYQQLGQQPPAGEARRELRSAVMTFGKDVQFLVEEPTSDSRAVTDGLDATRVDGSGQEVTFAALRTAIKQYLPQRPAGGKLVLVLVTDEAGDDWMLVDELIADIRREALPIYVIGNPAPLGMIRATRAAVETPSEPPPSPDWVVNRQGPESRYPEFVAFQAALGEQDLNVFDSGFGPFGLEWICRAGGGSYLAIRPRMIKDYVGLIPDTWPSSYVKRSSREAMRGYTPEYITDSEYQALLTSNRAAAALARAAKLEPAAVLVAPTMEFTKTNEAQFAQMLNVAQQQPALAANSAKEVYDVLKQGEADRDKLTSPRWRAAYDLALGRASISLARIDGYNSMLARLKRGAAFQKPVSTTWILVPDQELPDSGLQKMADRGRELLQRVVSEHPGTPWALLAEHTLEKPSGWKWTER